MRQFIAPSIAFFTLTLGLLLGHARAQTNPSNPSSDAAKTQAQSGAQAAHGPRASDVASMDNIIAALYDVISGPAMHQKLEGEIKNWTRFIDAKGIKAE